MSSKMEQIIEEIEEYIDGCKFQPLSSTKIIVNKEELEELIAELRAKTPEEVKRYQKIISNKEAILADAQAKADQIIRRYRGPSKEGCQGWEPSFLVLQWLSGCCRSGSWSSDQGSRTSRAPLSRPFSYRTG